MKKIWITGKVYDLDVTPIADIESDIEKRLLDYTNIPIIVDIKIINDHEMEILYHRVLNVDLVRHKDHILEEDCWLITGEGYQGFMPAYTMTNDYPHFPNINIFIYKKDFEKLLKMNEGYYTGLKVKSVKVTEKATELITHITFQ